MQPFHFQEVLLGRVLTLSAILIILFKKVLFLPINVT